MLERRDAHTSAAGPATTDGHGRTATNGDAINPRRFLLPVILLHAVLFAITASAYSVISNHADRILIFYRLFAEDWRIAGVGLSLLVLAPAWAVLLGRRAEAAAALAQARPATIAIGFVLAATAGARWVYLAHPLAMDEFAAIFQARIFAAGELTGRIPPDLMDRAFGPGFLGFFFSGNPATGQVISNYWPGFALLLTPFAALGVPWLLNPLIGGATIVVFHRLATRLYPGTDAGGWAVLFALASPVILVTSMSYYAMPAHLLANSIFVLLLLDRTPARLFQAGVTGSIALSLHQPFPHAVFALPFIVWIAASPRRWRNLGVLAAGYAPIVVTIFGGWAWVGSIMHAGTTLDPDSVVHSGGTALERAIQMLRFVFHLPDTQVLIARLAEAAKLVIWSAPGLTVLAAIGVHSERRRPECRVLAAAAALTLLAYLPVAFDQGHGWGNRYFHPAWMALPILAAGRLAGSGTGLFSSPGFRRMIGGTALASMLLLNAIALWTAGSFIRGQLRQLPDRVAAGHQVMLVDVTKGYYTNDLVQNDPFLRGPVVYVWGTGAPTDDDYVVRHFPGAEFATGDSIARIWTLPGPAATVR